MTPRGPGLAFVRDPVAHLARGADRGLAWWVRIPLWIVAAFLASGVIIAPLDLYSQVMFGSTVFAVALICNWVAPGRQMTLSLMVVSMLVSLRYIHWRVSTTVGNEAGLDMALGIVLLVAEIYAVFVLYLGFHQTAWPLRRRPVALPDDTAIWPTVDIYIPTYNEPLAVVRATVFAALELDWPADKFAVHILDDGRRETFRRFAQEVGVNYIIRPDNAHAKAGNINHALGVTSGEYIAIFDCDHVPTRSFLQSTMGWFVRDAKLALVQTPHHFYSPDPFERNLGTFKHVPNEGELFYGVLQKGNDLWDSTFFCGSCAVIRRSAMEDIGGMARETVTEDAHTMLRMHRKGYRAAYLDVPQAAGLATESLSAHVGQRIRWARGMAQIFRIDNPLFGRGLRLSQRFCYLAAMVHFFYGIPRIIFLISPLFYLFFGAHIFNASADMILAFALPHLAHAILTNSRIQGRHRHSFWAEVYEATLAYYILIPTTLALISPKLGKFNVTAKGGVIADSYFDLRIALPHLILLALNVTGAGLGIWRLTQGDAEAGAVAVNLAWTAYNVLIITAALAVAWESRQLRVQPRVDSKRKAMLWLPDETTMTAETINISLNGVQLRVAGQVAVSVGDVIEMAFVDGEDVPIAATLVQRRGDRLHLRFDTPQFDSEAALVRNLFSPPDAWITWAKDRRKDHPVSAMLSVFRFGIRGAVRMPAAFFNKRKSVARLLLGLALATGLATEPANANSPDRAGDVTLLDLGLTDSVRQYTTRPRVDLPFFARKDEVLTSAGLVVRLADTAPDGVEAVEVFVNDEQVGSVNPAARRGQSVDLPIDKRLLDERNLLSFRLVLASTHACPARVPLGTWKVIRGGTLSTSSAPLPLPDYLSQLPMPFFDAEADTVRTIEFTLFGERTSTMLKAALLAASYFGLRGGDHLRYHVNYDMVSTGSAVVLITNADAAAIDGLPVVSQPTLQLIQNPDDPAPNAKLLVIQGPDEQGLLLAATRLAVDFDAAKADTDRVVFDYAPEIPLSKPWDAPFIVPAGQDLTFDKLTEPTSLEHQSALGGTLRIDWRMPPVIFTWPDQSIDLELKWRHEFPSKRFAPDLTVVLNGHFIGNLPRAGASGEVQSHTLQIPTVHLAGYNHLQVHVAPPDDICPNPKDVVTTTFLPESTFKTGQFPQYAELPDITRFLDDGFPFSRLADMHETVLATTEDPPPGEVATALSFASHIAGVTGVPPIRLSIVPLTRLQPSNATGRDLIVIAETQALSALSAWGAHASVDVFGGEPTAKDVPWTRHALAFFQGSTLGEDLDRIQATLTATSGQDEPTALVVGLESPFDPGRTAIVVTATSNRAMPNFDELRGYAIASTGRGDVLTLRGSQRGLYQLGEMYTYGSLAWFKQARYFVGKYWFMLLPSVFLVALIVGWVLRRRLAQREFRRLSTSTMPSEVAA